MSTVTLDNEQQTAIDEAVHAVKNENRNYTIGGLAGTGKTTIARDVVAELGNVAVCAFTGKAASVLRSKGLPQARTIHSTIYHHDGARFVLLDEIDADCFLVDEGSMVNARLWEDMQSFGIPIIVIGDHGQLEPIGDNPNLMASCDIHLETIHRQGEGSEIIEFAHHVRNGGAIRYGTKGNVTIGRRDLFWASIDWADQLLCGFNRTRCVANRKARALRGLTSKIEDGDRLICLMNDRDLCVFNGQLMTVERVVRTDEHNAIVEIITDDGEKRRLTITLDMLGVEKFDNRACGRHRGKKMVVDYGYCTTVHKFQGSEDRNIAVLDQQCSMWDATQHRYTSITRASENLRFCL